MWCRALLCGWYDQGLATPLPPKSDQLVRELYGVVLGEVVAMEGASKAVVPLCWRRRGRAEGSAEFLPRFRLVG